MLKNLKESLVPKVTAHNPDHSFVISGIMRWRLVDILSSLPGIVMTRKPGLLGSSALPLAEFEFKGVTFQVDHGGDTGGDGLWIMPYDRQRHPEELKVLREHIEKSFR